MDEFTSTLVKKFNFKPKYIRRLKYMYICNTDKGTKIIKPVNYGAEKVLFVHKVKEHLRNKGFNQLDFYYISDEGLPYVFAGEMLYVMTDYIDLNECDLSNITDIKKSVELMATFHKLSQGLYKKITDDINFVNIKQIFEKKITAFIKMKKQVAKQKSLTDFEVLFIKNYEYFYKSSVEALEIINKYNYDIINNMARKNIMICHNKLKEETILIGKKPYLTHFENITIDHFIHDLSGFIIRYIRKHGAQYIKLEEILSIYSKINHIDPNVLPILYALIKFPDRYIDTCKKFFERRRTFIPISISSQVENVLALKDFHFDYISNIKP